MKYLSLLLALIPLAIQPNRRAAVPPHSNMIEVVLPGPAMATLLDAVFGGRGQIFVAGPRPAEVNAKEKEAKAKQYTRAPFELMNPGYKGKALEIWKARIQEEYDQYLPAHSQ